MKLLETVLDNQPAVRQIALCVGVSNDQTIETISLLVPVLARGLQINTQTSAGLNALLGALNRGSHQRYIAEPSSLAAKSTIDDGNAILSHILSIKDVSRNLAAYAARQTSIGSHRIKKMLPLVASLTMATLSRETERADSTAPLGGTTESVLTSLLVTDNQGSIADDLLGMAGKVFTP
ncbi:MAG: DUF937 domain-containing protein [Pseudomonadales bacterium]